MRREKRVLDAVDFNADCDQLQLHAPHQQQQPPHHGMHKRQCTFEAHASPSRMAHTLVGHLGHHQVQTHQAMLRQQQQQHLEMLLAGASPEALAFLQRVLRLPLCPDAATSADGQHQLAESCSDPAWQCVAELNLLADANLHRLPASALRGYHSFTRAPKAELWARFAAQQPQSSSQAQGAGPAQGAVELRMVAHILARAYDTLPEATIIKYTFETPDWLRGWCTRWHQTGPCVSVYAVHGHFGHGMHRLDRVLYVPVLTGST